MEEQEVAAAVGRGVTEVCGGGQYGADTASPRADIKAILGIFIKSSHLFIALPHLVHCLTSLSLLPNLTQFIA